MCITLNVSTAIIIVQLAIFIDETKIRIEKWNKIFVKYFRPNISNELEISEEKLTELIALYDKLVNMTKAINTCFGIPVGMKDEKLKTKFSIGLFRFRWCFASFFAIASYHYL